MKKVAEGEGTKSTKATKVKIGAAIGTVTAAVVIVAAILFTKEESYRTIAVEEVNGITLVASNGQEAVNAFEGMHLFSGDDVSVQQDSDMTMVLDADKYVYAEPGTHFWLECEGSADDSRTVIYMDEGSVLNRIKDNLNDGEIYQVDTPNSTMAVRGTVFRVTVYRGEDGLVYTLLEVFEGHVQADLKTEDGKYNGISESFGPGEAALIRGNSDFSEFVTGGEGDTNSESIKKEISYKEIPQNTARVLAKYMDEGTELCIGKELLMDYTQLTEHRMETRVGKESTCTEAGYEEIWCVVCSEVTETVALPLKEHEPGEWKVTLEPTCEEVGSRQKECTMCGAVCEKEEIEKLGHQAGPLQTLANATCTETGSQTAYCEVCGDELQRFATNALGHTAGGTSIVKNASCKEEGISRTVCTVCGTVLSENSIAKTGHSWGGWTTVSSGNCTSQGVERRMCSSCGTTEEQTTGGGKHIEGAQTIIKQATCKEPGIAQTACTVCGVILSSENIAASDHDWNWKVTSEVTCEEDGQETGICSVCGETDTKTIVATGHDMTWTPLEDTDFPCVKLEIGICSACDYVDEKVTEKHIYEGHDHMDYDISYENGTGTVTCMNMCIFCYQTDETPIHESCKVSMIDNMLQCSCGFDIPY